MGAKAVKFENRWVKFTVNEHEIWSNVTVSKAVPFAMQSMIAVFRRQQDIGNEQIENRLEFSLESSGGLAFLDAAEVFLESG